MELYEQVDRRRAERYERRLERAARRERVDRFIGIAVGFAEVLMVCAGFYAYLFLAAL